MSDSVREALQTLRDNIRDEKGSVQRRGVHDNNDTRDAIAVLLENEAALAAAEARIAELETEMAQWRDMGIRAVTGGRGVEGGDLIPNQIWPNGWQQDIAMVAYLIHCHEVRIAALEEALEPFANEPAVDRWFAYSDDSHLFIYPTAKTPVGSRFTIGDLRRAAALLKEKE